MQEFSHEVCEQLGYYVYGLIDPRNGRYFYIGKGQGNRVFAHIKDAENGCDSSEKLEIIREINNDGLEPVVMILRHGLKDENTAFAIEATLIDFIRLDNLSNKVAGVNADFGINSAEDLQIRYSCKAFKEDETTPKFIIIKITKKLLEQRGNSLYETCRSAWKIDPQKAKNYPYVLCVLNGVVKEVYKVNGEWKPDHRENSGRWEFEGKEAEERIRELFRNQRIPEHYRQKGQASPVLYSK